MGNLGIKGISHKLGLLTA